MTPFARIRSIRKDIYKSMSCGIIGRIKVVREESYRFEKLFTSLNAKECSLFFLEADKDASI